jgi:hypothetical protein
VLVLAVCGFTTAVSSASAANFTWSGSAAVGEPNWSNGTNWEGTAPSGSVGTLTFPKLTRPACSSEPPTETCANSTNDLTGLAAEAIVIDEDANYDLKFKEITLGSGGITATASEGVEGAARLELPIALASSQTWSVAGVGSAFTELSVLGLVTGAQTLHLDLSHGAKVGLHAGAEVGALSIVGGNSADTGARAGENGYLEGFELNATNGNPVSLTDAALSGGASVGPLTSTGGEISLADFSIGTLTVNGGVTLDGASALSVSITKSGPSAGTDYSQLSASGPVVISGELSLGGFNQSGAVCPTLHTGEVDTLVTTSGALSGQFFGIPDGQLIPVRSTRVEGFGEVRPRCATARVNYSAHSVTATIVSVTPPPSNASPPSIAGNTWAGQTLTSNGGTWINEAEPGGYSGPFVQWQDCDAAGNGCSPIEGAFEPTYTLAAADVGHTIRVQESFFNVAGSGPPVESPATGVVTSSQPQSKPEPKPEPKLEPKPESPILGQRQIVSVRSGTVTVRVKGTSSFVRLASSIGLSDGSEVDATKGRVLITAATLKAGQTVSAEVYGGRFRIHQDANGETHFILTLPLTGCPRVHLPHGSAAAVSAKHRSGPRSRHLWVSESGGKWGTNGRYVSTSVEGTRWLTTDECNQSQVKAATGKVVVDDLVRRKTKTLKAGRLYVAVRRGAHRA